jgi:RNA polymerase sigma-70 factor (ECF subfamily)
MSGQSPTLADLAARHRQEILAYLVRLLGNSHDAQDACQDAFLRAHRAFPRLRHGTNLRAWLYRIATNTALNVARGRARRSAGALDVDPDTLPAAADLAADRRATLRAIARAAAALPPRQRAALMLRQFQGLAYAEIAASLGGSEEAARANVYQAIRTLRRALGVTP